LIYSERKAVMTTDIQWMSRILAAVYLGISWVFGILGKAVAGICAGIVFVPLFILHLVVVIPGRRFMTPRIHKEDVRADLE